MNNSFRLRFVHYKFYILTVVSAVLFMLMALNIPSVKGQSEQALSADAFVDSIGVAVHLRYLDTPYGKYNSIIKPRLNELGVRHIRDGGSEPIFLEKLNDLASVGIRSTLVMDPRDGIKPADAVKIAKTVANSVEAIEGPNETDLNEFSYNGAAFPKGTRIYQKALYTAIKKDPETTALPVLMPSMGWALNASKLGFLSACDLGNMHSYAGSQPPTHHLDDRYIPNVQIVCGTNKPIMASETGYQNAIENLQSKPAISEQASAKYLSRLLLEYFNRRIRRTFLYELINEKQGDDPEWNFGLLRYDGSPKPAFTAIKHLILLLNDPDSNFSPESLNYQLSGQLTNVHHTLLQKRDGTFYLILWQEVKSWDNVNRKDIIVADKAVTVTLNTAIREVTVYRPLDSITPVQLYSQPKQIKLGVPDEPVVLKLVQG